MEIRGYDSGGKSWGWQKPWQKKAVRLQYAFSERLPFFSEKQIAVIGKAGVQAEPALLRTISVCCHGLTRTRSSVQCPGSSMILIHSPGIHSRL